MGHKYQTEKGIKKRLYCRVELTHQKGFIFYGHSTLTMIYRIRKKHTIIDGYLYIKKRSPTSEIFRGKKGNNNISIIFYSRSFCSSSIIIIYRIIKYFHIFGKTVCLEIFALSIDFGVKSTKLGFTP